MSDTAYLMIQHRIVNGVTTTDGDTFQEAHDAMLSRVRAERWIVWALPYVEVGHADVR